MKQEINRRDLLKIGFGSLALGCIGFSAANAFAAGKFKDIPLSLQLYTVHGITDNPVKRFEDVAKMGYKGVEYAGFGASAKDLRKFQDDAGLFCSGSHNGRDQIEDLEKLKRAIEFHQILGAKFIICAGMTNEGIDGWKRAAENYSKSAEFAKKEGICIGYHAHPHDFNIIDKENNLTSWEIFADNSIPEVVLQIDVGHCVNAKTNPYRLIKKYPGRSKTVHVKESDGKILGNGRVDWIKAFNLLESVGGVENYSIEYEADMDRMEAAKLSAEAFYNIRK